VQFPVRPLAAALVPVPPPSSMSKEVESASAVLGINTDSDSVQGELLACCNVLCSWLSHLKSLDR
jgi:hypothetical protein